MSLQLAMRQWDGKSADDIAQIYQQYAEQNNFKHDCLVAIDDESLQVAATWLLKHAMEQGERLSEAECLSYYGLIGELKNWESNLHFLQSMPFMPIDKTVENNVVEFLRDKLMDSNKFVRAWAYNGFYELSLQYPEYRKETEQFFEMAMRDEVASVKARIRNILKKGF